MIDLETKSLNSPKPNASSKRLENRIEELTNRLSQSTKDGPRLHRTTDQSVRDVKSQLVEADRHRVRLEEEVKTYETKVLGMRKTVDELVCHAFLVFLRLCLILEQRQSESTLQLEKRRAEREAADFKQKALRSVAGIRS